MTQDFLKENIQYNRETGEFFRIKDRYGNKCFINICTSKDTAGYYQFRLFHNNTSRKYKAHRMAWLYEHGELPKMIDHINHIRDDNRMCNLREIQDRKENNKNKTMFKTNTSGVTGVYWQKSIKRWTAKIRVNKKLINLGAYGSKEDAIIARKNAEIKYEFHANHGK